MKLINITCFDTGIDMKRAKWSHRLNSNLKFSVFTTFVGRSSISHYFKEIKHITSDEYTIRLSHNDDLRLLKVEQINIYETN